MLSAPGPHPDAATLRQYAAGTLGPAEEQRIEAHTIDCERCADLLAGFSLTDAPTTDRALAALRTRLQNRVGPPAPVALAPHPLWPRVAAAAAVAVLLAGGLIWQGRDQLTPTPEPVARHTETPAEVPAPTPAVPAPAVAVVPPPVRRPAARPRVLARRRVRPATSGATASTSPAAAVVPTDAETRPAPAVAAPPAETAPDLALQEAPLPTTNAGTQELSEPAEPTAAPAAKARRLAKAAAPAAEAGGHRAEPMPAGPTIAPAPMGGTLALREYVRRSADQFYPTLTAGRLSGSVHVRFTVEEDGRVSNVKVTRRLRPDYDAEAQRIVCDGPSWQPGIAGGRRAPLPVDIVVPF